MLPAGARTLHSTSADDGGRTSAPALHSASPDSGGRTSAAAHHAASPDGGGRTSAPAHHAASPDSGGRTSAPALHSASPDSGGRTSAPALHSAPAAQHPATITGTRRRRPTLKAVALSAGVSTSTASLVYSGKGPVAAETKERVLAAAAALGFQGPNPVASSLRTGRAGVVAVIGEGRLMQALRDPFALAVLDGLAEALDEMSVSMLLLAQSLEHPERTVDRLAATGLDAAVLLACGSDTGPLVDHLERRGVPIVSLGAPAGADAIRIDIDNHGAMRALAEHVRGLGHTRVATITLLNAVTPSPGIVPLATLLAISDHPDCRGRLEGLREVYGDALPCVETRTSDIEAGAEAARALLDVPADRRPTAILAQSDQLAMGAVRVAQELGLRIGEDVSITGFDGVPTPWWPGVLTTIVQPAGPKGTLAGEIVAGLLDGEVPESVVLGTELRIGTSTGPAPA